MARDTAVNSFLYGANSHFIEDLYDRYLANPTAVDASWRAVFDEVKASGGQANGHVASWTRQNWPTLPTDDMVLALDAGIEMPPTAAAKGAAPSEAELRAATLDSVRALMLIRSHRVRGHLVADLDPLGLDARPPHPELEPATYGFAEKDMERPIFLDGVLGFKTATMRQIMATLGKTYCGTIGVEFMHISEPTEKSWIQNHIEGIDKGVNFTLRTRRAILQKLSEAELFERYLNRKYTGTKRFGLDGAEALIPAMEAIIGQASEVGVHEIVLGMPHRGRLNVLGNIMMKPLRAIFNEFQGGSSNPDEVQGSGDVKYHLGTSADREFDGRPIHLSLTANPSHLEAVNPVVLGKVRSKQTLRGDRNRLEVMGLLLHGDAAFAGQGVIAECFGLSQLKGTRTGGTIHIIVNNQIGFTTAPRFSRSSPYPSDSAKMVQAPIFHVNGDDPEAVVHVCRMATRFRQTFRKDVVIDMFCYRRHGHNESDEPAFTQPLMYRAIADHPSTREIYAKRLADSGVIPVAESQDIAARIEARLDSEFAGSEDYTPGDADWLGGKWQGLEVASGDVRRGKTAVALKELKTIGKALVTVPEHFHLHRTITRLLKNKGAAIEKGTGIDWATGEALAFGSLINEGFKVRLSGQDSGRGTFSQRHSVLVDQQSEERFIPLNSLGESPSFEVIDSMLSEAAVLGFEYGFSLADPDALILWEAQFGDFANGAQVIIDQFISSGESKWLRMCGLVMLLPHGFEGQGPEHSSARLERYLQLCGEDNMQVANCTTPASYFHILRRQLHRKFRKPLVIFTPKSLLRHKKAVSRLTEFGPGTSFHRVLWDDAQLYPEESIKLLPDKDIGRVILCTGKVYYDLLEERNRRQQKDTCILRLEQLYPFPRKSLKAELSRFPEARVMWCQEEPKNMGAWFFVDPLIEEILGPISNVSDRPVYAGRQAAASPATGLLSHHLAEQKGLVDAALTA